MSSAYVVDASVVLKLFVDEELSGQARALLGRLALSEPDQFFAPDLFLAECASVLWKYVQFYGYDGEIARANLADLSDLAIQTVSVASLFQEAFEISCRLNIAVYDACYVALAEGLGCPLVTADEILARRLAGEGLAALYLGDLPCMINRPAVDSEQ
ncbi:MAG: type II toxin-antitoxin system VapC family toxin [Anaerolineae bacterium]|nr:type II toxin-antitoxin system VapC family toxin [Anaerolineae bacterium]